MQFTHNKSCDIQRFPRKLDRDLVAIRKIDRKIKAYEEWRANNNTAFKAIDKEIADDDAKVKDLKAQQDGILQAAIRLSSEQTALEKMPNDDPSETVKAEHRKRIQGVREQSAIVVERYRAIAKALDEFGKTEMEHERQHNKTLSSLKPGLTQVAYQSLKEEEKKIHTEYHAADLDSESRRKIFQINNASLSLQLDFKVTENDNASTSGTLTWPIHLGNIALAYKAGEDKGRVAQRVVNTTSLFEELTDTEKLGCPDTDDGAVSYRAQKYPVVGKVGVDEFIAQYFKINESTTITSGADTFTDKLTFTTKISGDLNPTIEFKPISLVQVKAGFDINADRTDVHIVSLQIRPYTSPTSPSDPKLQITKIPSVNVSITEGLDGHSSNIGIR